MTKEALIEVDGTVVELLPDLRCRVRFACWRAIASPSR
jgi:translation initiation factor IF-1